MYFGEKLKKNQFLFLVTLSFSSFAEEDNIDCGNAFTTIDINRCAGIELELAQKELKKYLKASFDHHSFDQKLVQSIKLAQKDWQAYTHSHCKSVYTQWRGGSIRGVMGISCKTRLTKQRTHELWKNFLTYMDSTSPVLPEPSKH